MGAPEARTATVGISDGARVQLGDVIFVELPAVGTRLRAGERFGVVESVEKAASDLYAPVAGTVSEVNGALAAGRRGSTSPPMRRDG